MTFHELEYGKYYIAYSGKRFEYFGEGTTFHGDTPKIGQYLTLMLHHNMSSSSYKFVIWDSKKLWVIKNCGFRAAEAMSKETQKCTDAECVLSILIGESL